MPKTEARAESPQRNRKPGVDTGPKKPTRGPGLEDAEKEYVLDPHPPPLTLGKRLSSFGFSLVRAEKNPAESDSIHSSGAEINF